MAESAMACRWVHAPPGSHWSEFGAGDQRGRMNLVTPRLPLHEHCPFKNGMHLGELWYQTELAAWLRSARRHRFLLTAPPTTAAAGALGSPVTPIATV